MLPPCFNHTERAFLLSKKDGWDELEGLPRERTHEGNLINPRDEFISNLIGDFFDMFPARDSSCQPNGTTAFSAKERDRLHTASIVHNLICFTMYEQQIFKKFFYSQNTCSTDDTPPAPDRFKYVSLLGLFKQRYRQRILTEGNRIRESDVAPDPLDVYNLAVTVEFDKLKSNEPAKFQELQ